MAENFLADISVTYPCDYVEPLAEGDEIRCEGRLAYLVYHSNSGYYIGWFCSHCGPYSRQSNYYASRTEAEEILARRLAWATESQVEGEMTTYIRLVIARYVFNLLVTYLQQDRFIDAVKYLRSEDSGWPIKPDLKLAKYTVDAIRDSRFEILESGDVRVKVEF